MAETHNTFMLFILQPENPKPVWSLSNVDVFSRTFILKAKEKKSEDEEWKKENFPVYKIYLILEIYVFLRFLHIFFLFFSFQCEKFFQICRDSCRMFSYSFEKILQLNDKRFL